VSRITVPTVIADMDFDVAADLFDRHGDVVARATVRWRLGPLR
jgi:hypothetical protein